MLTVKHFVFNPFMENTYLLFDETSECIIVDPGCYEKYEQEELLGFIEREKLNIKLLVNTHCHIDHVLGNAFIKNRFNVKFAIHKIEFPVLKAVKVYAPNYGFNQYHYAEPEIFLNEGEQLRVGNQTINILYVPGHSPGHIAFYEPATKSLIGGDVLFQNSIGRTDLPGGNFDTLINSIREKFFTLPDEVTVYCGHGPTTSIGFEKRTNPFCTVIPQ